MLKINLLSLFLLALRALEGDGEGGAATWEAEADLGMAPSLSPSISSVRQDIIFTLFLTTLAAVTNQMPREIFFTG